MGTIPNAAVNEIHPARALPVDLVDDLQRVQKAAQRITSILDLDQLIDSVVNDHTSILRFVEERYGLSALSTRDAAANPMLEAFDFTKPGRVFQPI